MADNAVTGTTGLIVAADYLTDATLGSSILVQYVKIMDGTIDGTNKWTVDTGGAARVTLYSTSGTAATFNVNGRATPANSAPVVIASQKAQTVSSSTSATALTGGSGGAVGDWLDGFLVTPTSTSPGALTLVDGSTGTASTLFSGGSNSVSNLVPFWIPYPATSQTSAWRATVGAALVVTAFGNFT